MPNLKYNIIIFPYSSLLLWYNIYNYCVQYRFFLLKENESILITY